LAEFKKASTELKQNWEAEVQMDKEKEAMSQIHENGSVEPKKDSESGSVVPYCAKTDTDADTDADPNKKPRLFMRHWVRPGRVRDCSENWKGKYGVICCESSNRSA
jgi:hypothetical protein